MGGVIVIIPILRSVGRVFEPQLGQNKKYKTGICCFSSKYTILKSKINWLGISMMCLNRVTCLPMERAL